MIPVILWVSLFSQVAQASFQSLQAPWLQIMPAGIAETKPKTRGPLRLFFRNNPKGKALRANFEECSSLELKKEVSRTHSPQAISNVIQSFFTRCDDKLSRFPQSKLGAMLRMAEG